jgi:hypothetical protein
VPDLTFRRYGAAAARTVRDLVADIHRDAYAEHIATGDGFAADKAFMQRYDAYTARTGFDLVLAVDQDGASLTRCMMSSSAAGSRNGQRSSSAQPTPRHTARTSGGDGGRSPNCAQGGRTRH